jgi:hypothetical protein
MSSGLTACAEGPGQGVLVLDVPVGRVPTLYACTGEIAPLLALAFLAYVATAGLRVARGRGHREEN